MILVAAAGLGLAGAVVHTLNGELAAGGWALSTFVSTLVTIAWRKTALDWWEAAQHALEMLQQARAILKQRKEGQ